MITVNVAVTIRSHEVEKNLEAEGPRRAATTPGVSKQENGLRLGSGPAGAWVGAMTSLPAGTETREGELSSYTNHLLFHPCRHQGNVARPSSLTTGPITVLPTWFSTEK
jgi:hypothetical protein